METQVLVEIVEPGSPLIKAVIRTYESNNRAQEDLELLQEQNPEKVYLIIPTQFIDR